MNTLLKTLVEAAGPSGYEGNVRDIIRTEIAPYAEEIKVDTLGNLIVRVGKKSTDGKRILIAAHMDEIGLIVSHVEKNGLVRFSNIGTVFGRYLAGNRVKFLNGTRGVIDSDKSEDLSRLQPLEKFFIDVGAASDKDCPVKPGDLAIFDREFMEIGNRWVAKSLDDRTSCAVLIETIKQVQKSPNDLSFVFSTQEEVGSRGAQTAAYDVDAELGIAVDVTPVGNLMGLKMQVDLGAGPAIKVRDVGMISDPRVVKWMTKGAEEARIPHQMEVLQIGSTDSRVMQISKAGMLAGALSIPCRYVHSPSEMIDQSDYASTIKLLVHLLNHPVVLK
jgi:tetrahedral aminopeptidase